VFSVSDVAVELGVSRQRVHQLLDALDITPRTIGGVFVLTPAERRRLLNRKLGKPGRPKRGSK